MLQTLLPWWHVKTFYKKHFRYFTEINNSEGELTDEVIVAAYKSIGSFYNNDIENPVGIEHKERLLRGNGYLVPHIYSTIKDIKRNLIGWYRSQ